jgi:uncharacterized protein YcbK (DUF882 family)
MAAVAGTILPVKAIAADMRTQAYERKLAFQNLNTWESLRVCYYRNNALQPAALAKINYILRDHHTNTITDIDTNLLDLLYTVDQQIEGDTVFQVLSGYRTSQTNQLLFKRTRGVAKNSLHIQGQAVDIRIPGCDTFCLCDLFIQLQAGGVGYYPRRNFVHIDTGPVRTWQRT